MLPDAPTELLRVGLDRVGFLHILLPALLVLRPSGDTPPELAAGPLSATRDANSPRGGMGHPQMLSRNVVRSSSLALFQARRRSASGVGGFGFRMPALIAVARIEP